MPRQHQRCHLHPETLREVRQRHWTSPNPQNIETGPAENKLTTYSCVPQADATLWRAPQSGRRRRRRRSRRRRRRSRIQNPRNPNPASQTQRDQRKEAAAKRQKTRTQSQGEEDGNQCCRLSNCKWQETVNTLKQTLWRQVIIYYYTIVLTISLQVIRPHKMLIYTDKII